MIAGNKIWLAERTSKNFKSLRNTKRDTTSTSNNNPGLPRKIGIARKQSGISNTKIQTARFSPTTLAGKMKDTIQRNDWSKDRYSRRTKRTYNPMQCIFMFCIVLQPYVYLYTQFQKPSRLVNCWISLKFTGKTIKNFHLQWDSNPPMYHCLGKSET